MTKYQRKIFYKVKELRKKYRDLPDAKKLNEQLSKVCWYSLPCMYGANWVAQVDGELWAEYHIKRRLYQSCYEVLQKAPCRIMLTLTLNDIALSYEQSTLVKKVKEYCARNLVASYVFADYGAVNGRLHFHIIASTYLDKMHLVTNLKGTFVNMVEPWQYGFHTVSPIKGEENAIKYAKKSFQYASKSNGLRWRSRGNTRFVYPFGLSCYMNQLLPYSDIENLNF